MKIRGNTVGTPMRPDKAFLVAAEAMTEEQKAQVRENIGADQVFIAEYGKTTFADMVEAYNAGKLIFCRSEKYLIPMYELVAGTSVSFYRVVSSAIENYFCTSNGKWNRKTLYLCASKHEGFESRITALEERIAALESARKTITFYLDGSAYTAQAGMTWEEFVGSEYNPTFVDEECCNIEHHHFRTFLNSEDDVGHTDSCCGPPNGILVSDDGMVYKTDEIIAGYHYYTSNDY